MIFCRYQRIVGMMEVVSAYFTAHWQVIKDFFNSNGFTAIAGAMAGAYAGAHGAKLIADRSKLREQLLIEIRGTNAATLIAATICNSLLALKRQHIKEIVDTHANQTAGYNDFHGKREAGHIPPHSQFVYFAIYRMVSLYPLPIELLQKQIFEKLSVGSRPLALCITLGQTAHNLTSTLARRNQLIEEQFNDSAKPELEKAEIYFGLPNVKGQINYEYPTNIALLNTQTNDCIYFAYRLTKDIEQHGEELAAKFKEKFGKDAPKVTTADFSDAIKSGLIPSPENYPDWESKFIKHPDPA
jgi:hypothetical protein